MGYQLMKGEEFTFHHILKKEHGGDYGLKNGAILCGKTAHPYIHIVEQRDLDIFIFINKVLKQINNQGHVPDINQLKRINDVLKIFEREHQGEITSKGKILIKDEYTERRILTKQIYI